jgi:hypothetical protein
MLVWICVGVVALPLSRCAFFTGGCHQHQPQAKADAAAAQDRFCCAHGNEPAPRPSQSDRENPCTSDCCRTSPFAPASEKPIVAPPPVVPVAMLPQFDNSATGGIAVATTAVLQPLSLNILHCQWRC